MVLCIPLLLLLERYIMCIRRALGHPINCQPPMDLVTCGGQVSQCICSLVCVSVCINNCFCFIIVQRAYKTATCTRTLYLKLWYTCSRYHCMNMIFYAVTVTYKCMLISAISCTCKFHTTLLTVT